MPVVLLVGCVTAASDEAASEITEEEIAERLKGGRNLAEQLVARGGVEVAIGMRYQLDVSAAEEFLRTFFDSLVGPQPGDVEAAVQAGRRRLIRP